MALKTLSLDYTRIIHCDRVPLHFDIVRKKDRQKKMLSSLHQWILLEK